MRSGNRATALIGRIHNDQLADIRNAQDIEQMQPVILQAELRSLSGQFGEPLLDLAPVSGSFSHTLRAEIGVRGRQGADAFEFEVCSPEMLESELERYDIVAGGPRLFCNRFVPEVVEEYVRKRLLHASGPDWKTIAAQLGQWSRWEFEGDEG